MAGIEVLGGAAPHQVGAPTVAPRDYSKDCLLAPLPICTKQKKVIHDLNLFCVSNLPKTATSQLYHPLWTVRKGERIVISRQISRLRKGKEPIKKINSCTFHSISHQNTLDPNERFGKKKD